VQRRVLAVVELRAPFSLARSELRDADRGAQDVDLSALDAAAHRIATAENRAVFHGWQAAGITGIAEASTQDPIALGDDCTLYPHHVAKAVEALLHAGIGGPHGLALGPDAYTRVLETEHGGYPLLNHLREIIGGPLVWSPGVQGAVVLSQRGGDLLRHGRPVPRGELHLPRRDAGGSGSAHTLTPQAAFLAPSPMSLRLTSRPIAEPASPTSEGAAMRRISSPPSPAAAGEACAAARAIGGAAR